MKLIFFSGLFILLCGNNLAQQINWVGNDDAINITRNVYFLKEPSDALTISEISTEKYRSQFRLFDKSVISFGFTESAIWLKFSLENKTSDSLWLEFEHAYIPHISLFFKDAGGTWRNLQSGYKVRLRDKVIRSHYQLFPLPAGKQEYFVRIVPLVHPIPIKIWDSTAYQIRADKQSIMYGVYSGLLLFAIIINIFLFIIFKKPYYILYSLLIFLYLCASAGVMEGYIIYYFPKTDLMDWYKIVPVLNMPVLLLYCISFFDLKKVSRKLYTFTVVICILLIVYIVTGLQLLPLLPVLFVNYLLALIVFIIAIVIGVVVARNGNKTGKYFVIAYSIWFLLLLCEEIYIQTGKPEHIFQLSYVSIAMFIEAFLLAFLLVKRFQWEKSEDEKLRFELQANLITVQQKFEQEIVQTKLEIRENVFQNISREIHDNIAQTLSLAKLHLSTLNLNLQESEKIKLSEAKNLVAKVIHDLRDIAKAINTDYIKHVGLVGAILQQLDILKKAGVFQINYLLDGDEEKYDSNKELFIFRIIQELLNNIVKHSNANRIDLQIEYAPDKIVITVSDNGRGFVYDRSDHDASYGLGLSNIIDRVKLIGGSILINSEPGKGTHIKLLVPKSTATTVL